MTAWLTVHDIKTFRASIADEATQFLDQEFAAALVEVARKDRSRAARLGWRTRKSRWRARVNFVADQLRAERGAVA